MQPGEYPTEAAALAIRVENPYSPGDTLAEMAANDGTGAFAAAHATMRITRVVGEPVASPGNSEAMMEGEVKGHLAWRGGPDGGPAFFDVDIWFQAVPFSVSHGSPAQRCARSWARRGGGQ